MCFDYLMAGLMEIGYSFDEAKILAAEWSYNIEFEGVSIAEAKETLGLS